MTDGFYFAESGEVNVALLLLDNVTTVSNSSDKKHNLIQKQSARECIPFLRVVAQQRGQHFFQRSRNHWVSDKLVPNGNAFVKIFCYTSEIR